MLLKQYREMQKMLKMFSGGKMRRVSHARHERVDYAVLRPGTGSRGVRHRCRPTTAQRAVRQTLRG